MQFHEHQAKEILKKYDLPVPEGRAIYTIDEVTKVIDELKGFPLVVKAQVHSGGRGKAGGVKFVKNQQELEDAATSLFGKVLKTNQCPEGRFVSRLLIEKATKIKAEFYFAIMLDRKSSQPIVIASKAGGMDIETVAECDSDALIIEKIDPYIGLMPAQARNLAFKLGLPHQEFTKIAMALYRMYSELDASLLEINPLVLTVDGGLIILDCKLDIEDNALFRHKDLHEMEDASQIDSLEIEAKKYNLNYVKLSGDIACMVNGAGLAMATMDTIKLAGGDPANFLDVGGGASANQIANAMRVLMSDKDVKVVFINIFGGILRCDRLAQGLIDATAMVEIRVPVVIRLEGTNVEEGRRLLAKSGLGFITTVADLWEGATTAAQLAKTC